jgi:hypothetical protein
MGKMISWCHNLTAIRARSSGPGQQLAYVTGLQRQDMKDVTEN